jgi:hypothetical protein
VVDKGKAAEEYYVVRNLCQQYWQENKQPSWPLRPCQAKDTLSPACATQTKGSMFQVGITTLKFKNS